MPIGKMLESKKATVASTRIALSEVHKAYRGTEDSVEMKSPKNLHIEEQLGHLPQQSKVSEEPEIKTGRQEHLVNIKAVSHSVEPYRNS